MTSYFVLKLIPHRASFAQDMTAEERKTMGLHVAYWKELMNLGIVITFGPVLDPKGVYGLGIVGVEDEKKVKEIIGFDPANGLNQYEYYPMMAILPEKRSRD
jgi:uncharacterized protein